MIVNRRYSYGTLPVYNGSQQESVSNGNNESVSDGDYKSVSNGDDESISDDDYRSVSNGDYESISDGDYKSDSNDNNEPVIHGNNKSAPNSDNVSDAQINDKLLPNFDLKLYGSRFNATLSQAEIHSLKEPGKKISDFDTIWARFKDWVRGTKVVEAKTILFHLSQDKNKLPENSLTLFFKLHNMVLPEYKNRFQVYFYVDDKGNNKVDIAINKEILPRMSITCRNQGETIEINKGLKYISIGLQTEREVAEVSHKIRVYNSRMEEEIKQFNLNFYQRAMLQELNTSNSPLNKLLHTGTSQRSVTCHPLANGDVRVDIDRSNCHFGNGSSSDPSTRHDVNVSLILSRESTHCIKFLELNHVAGKEPVKINDWLLNFPREVI